MTDEPFGRQPKPVMVTITGEPEDVIYWQTELMRRSDFKGDEIMPVRSDKPTKRLFRIYPRAVND